MFKPNFTITPLLASTLMRIEALRQEINHLPITPTVLASLRETARLESTHYSTKIEGNLLAQAQVEAVIKKAEHFFARERDEKEVLGYYAALDYIEQVINQKKPLSEKIVQMVHAFVMNGGKKNSKPTPYRDGQNVIRDAQTKKIVYLPPEAPDVPKLMKELITWIQATHETLPSPLQASIVHYQLATIHPYYDGNGRTARLLVTLLLHQGNYGLKGLYSLEEYYAKDLISYYQALSVGPSHNYYFGREEADITPWIEYFCLGMLNSFEHVKKRASLAFSRGERDKSQELRILDARQRKVLDLFKNQAAITSQDIALLLSIHPRTARLLCQQWIKGGFLLVNNSAKKNRNYGLTESLQKLLFDH